MALEVRVYREVTDIDAKVIAGLTWRQVAVAGVGVVVLAGAGAALYFMGNLMLLPYVFTVLMLPLVLWGWVKPMGMRFEKWLPYAWRALREPRMLRYGNEPMSLRQVKSFDDAHTGRKNVSQKEAAKHCETGQ